MIYAESRGMHAYLYSHTFGSSFLSVSPYILFGAMLVLAGYLVAAYAFQDAWFVAIVSLLTVLLVEPVVMYAFFQEFPSRGEIIGFFLAVLGMIATISL